MPSTVQMMLYFTVILIFGFAKATPLNQFLANPEDQLLFDNQVPNALDSTFKYQLIDNANFKEATVHMCNTTQVTGLRVNEDEVSTPVWGYRSADDNRCTWPGRTFEVSKNRPLRVEWINELYKPLLTGVGKNSETSVIDNSIHWALSLHDCNKDTTNPDGEDCGGIDALAEGIPVVPHLHGGHTKSEFDGNPEYFFTPEQKITGPRFVSNVYMYDNDQSAGTLWYHDHALGITRLNVYAGLAGFYIVRDNKDTGEEGNPLGLPAGEFEVALAIQDRMFKANGDLFYPAFRGDPLYADFIDGDLDEDVFGTEGGPTVLAEFFGDFMVVNGKIWPKMAAKPQEYRLRLLNGCDSRFLVIQFVEVAMDSTSPEDGIPKDFWVIGTDQGLASQAIEMDTLIFEPGARYDIIINFEGSAGNRVIMKNLGCDAPFGPPEFEACDDSDVFEARLTDRIMAFDIQGSPNGAIKRFDPSKIKFGNKVNGPVARTRQLSLFEGTDPYGRLLPILGLAEEGRYNNGTVVMWDEEYMEKGLVGEMQGGLAWHNVITENPCNRDVEIWEIYNPTGDSHPIHLHLVNFEVLGRHDISWHDPNEEVLEEDPQNPVGTYLLQQPIIMHDGGEGSAFALKNPTYNPTPRGPIDGVVNDGVRDMVTAFPGTVTRIKMKWDRPGRYVWHCHIVRMNVVFESRVVESSNGVGFLEITVFFLLVLPIALARRFGNDASLGCSRMWRRLGLSHFSLVLSSKSASPYLLRGCVVVCIHAKQSIGGRQGRHFFFDNPVAPLSTGQLHMLLHF